MEFFKRNELKKIRQKIADHYFYSYAWKIIVQWINRVPRFWRLDDDDDVVIMKLKWMPSPWNWLTWNEQKNWILDPQSRVTMIWHLNHEFYGFAEWLNCTIWYTTWYVGHVFSTWTKIEMGNNLLKHFFTVPISNIIAIHYANDSSN